MAINTLTTTAKLFYKESAFKGGIERLFFPIVNNSMNTTVSIDSLTGLPYAARTIIKGEVANVRRYSPGSGNMYEPPIVKEKTIIDEELSDAVVVGLEDNAPQMIQMREIVNNIVSGPMGHVAAHNMAKTKAAIDVMRTGIFYGKSGATVIDSIDFGKSTDLASLTYDFTATGATFDAGIKVGVDALVAKRVNPGNLAVVCGASWYEKFAAATAVTDKRKATKSLEVLNEKLIPQELMGIEGLYVAARYKVDGVVTPIWILVYTPPFQYLATDGGSDAPFFPDVEAVLFPIGAQAYRCNRGLSVVQNGKIVRAMGDIVFDEFKTDEPPATWIRSNSRYLYVPGNVNHSCKVTGTFA